MSKAFWKSRKGQIVFCVGGLLLSVIFLVSQFGGSLLGGLGGGRSKEALERELKKLQQEQVRLNAELADLETLRKAAESKFDGAWKQSVNGNGEVELRSLIENTARTLELRLNNISTVRRTNFNKDLSLLELDIAVTTDIDTLMRFLLAVDQIEPRLYWRRFDCRSSNMFGMQAVQFNGSLRCASDERSVENVPGKKAAVADDGKSGNKEVKK